MLGLKPGGETRGLAFRLSDEMRVANCSCFGLVRCSREFIHRSGVRLALEDGREIKGITFITDPEHPLL
ncbi:hypothetical protein [Hafnia alvei]|uniref:hypothetical protein n=1 Tax=Hafnia alvei TaxID=569 RepID=UPI003559317D